MTSNQTDQSIPHQHAIIRASDDPAKRDLELRCWLCEYEAFSADPNAETTPLCDVEHDDNLEMLMSVFREHYEQTHVK